MLSALIATHHRDVVAPMYYLSVHACMNTLYGVARDYATRWQPYKRNTVSVSHYCRCDACNFL